MRLHCKGRNCNTINTFLADSVRQQLIMQLPAGRLRHVSLQLSIAIQVHGLANPANVSFTTDNTGRVIITKTGDEQKRRSEILVLEGLLRELAALGFNPVSMVPNQAPQIPVV
eukprot:comp23786_c0_seq1/m.41280 comp23786_c0_seq1/g.41280  ORF comp23786_c0_seq1/g.41280 comp23786_c0_seq1/m.41280 type:complete len:113 (-) comp23786_c0_seq1:486-824(-)